MKKFMKVCALLALVLIAVGVVLGVTSQAAHGGTVSMEEIIEALTHGNADSELEEWGNRVMNELNQVNYDIDAEAVFDHDYEIWSGDVERRSVGESNDIRELNIEVGGCILKLESSPDNNYYIEGENTKKFQAYVQNGELHVCSLTAGKGWSVNETSSITLYLPETANLEEVDIELGAGRLEFGTLSADKIKLEAGAGEIRGETVYAREKLETEVGAGNLQLKDVSAAELKAIVSMGNLNLKGDITEKADIECSLGNITVELAGKETDYNFDIKSSAGSVKIGEEVYSGVYRQQMGNNADRNVEVQCSMGEIKVSFY